MPATTPPPVEQDDSQPISRPPGSGGSNAVSFGAGLVLGVGIGFLLAGTVCNKGGPEMTAGREPSTGVVVSASPDSGTAAPAEKPAQ